MLSVLWLGLAVVVAGDAPGGAEADSGDVSRARGYWDEFFPARSADRVAGGDGGGGGVVVDVEEQARRFRKSVHHLKANDKVEIVFLVDSSSSIGEDNFKSEMRFIQKLVADFNIGPSHARIAIVAYASTAKTHVNHLERLDGHEKCTFLHVELPRIEYTAGNTNTIGGLLAARDIFRKSREDAAKALFLVTDGFSNKGDPVPTAKELKNEGIAIFTFGIETGNVKEIREVSSEPTDDFCFVLNSFAQFEDLALRALFEDIKSGTYVALNDSAPCDRLCSAGAGCCNDRSRCSCGILTGHFACLCPPGHYGSGLVGDECKRCPVGTYHDGLSPGDVLACVPCPDANHVTLGTGAASVGECVCKDGYVPEGDGCAVATCPVLEPPPNGYFVKKNCSNVQNAACGVRCSAGYKLRGSSVRICQGSGTWSGTAPACRAKSCRRPSPVRDGTVTCTNEESGLEAFARYDSNGRAVESAVLRDGTPAEDAGDFNFTVDTTCAFGCHPGFTMVGSRMRTCLPILKWNGLATTCTVVRCPSLTTLKDGIVKPDNCTREGLRHGFATECFVSCRDGYRLEGPSLRNCTGRRGTWTGRNVANKCIDVLPPVMTCPGNVTTETIPEESYALVRLSLPAASDNSGAEPVVWSKPPFLPGHPLPLKIGTTRVEVYAVDATDNGDSCDFYVEVLDTESPRVYNCESPPTFYISDIGSGYLDLNWTEPVFIDNSGAEVDVDKSNAFGVYPVGTTTVTYTARDASGNVAHCAVDITVAENPCSETPDLGRAVWNCTWESSVMSCTVSCPPGLAWTSDDLAGTTVMCQYDRRGARWSPDVFSDLDSIPECSAYEIPDEAHEIEIDEDEDFRCDDLESLRILLGAGDSSAVSIDCDDAEDATTRTKRDAHRRRIKLKVRILGGNETSEAELRRHLQELERETAVVNGRRVKVHATKTIRARCPSGHVLKRGLCVRCPPGTYHDPSQPNCVPCPIGSYQSREGESSCESCPEGHLTRRRRRKQLKECKRICPPGTFGRIRNKKRKIALAPCTPCPAGTYQPSAGQTSCAECPEGRTTTRKGSAAEEQCRERAAVDDPCFRFPCRNNGTCSVYNGFAYCLCPEGFLGSFCERQRNYCDSSPCYNNGECVPTGATTYRCACPAGYEGDLCQFEVDDCASGPCLNGAECVDVANGYKCDCLPGYTGDNCEEDIDDCARFEPCYNGGTCRDQVNGYTCTCRPGFSGKHCEEVSECHEDDRVDRNCNVKGAIPDPCSGIICPANMECRAASRRHAECACRSGYYGKRCTEEINFEVTVTFPKGRVTEYMSADFPPEDVHGMSVSLWIKTDDAFNYGTLFSYAVGDYDNGFTVADYKGFLLYVRNERVVTDIFANDGRWHFIVVAWDSGDGAWEVYVDGRIRRNGTGLSPGAPVPGGGRFIVGQEQDRLGGGFAEIESFVGKITHVDVWRRRLTAREVSDMNDNCKFFLGDLVSWVHFLDNVHGDVEIAKSNFCTHCNARELRLHRGHVTIETDVDSTFAAYRCERGFRIGFDAETDKMIPHTDTWYRKCLKHGDWEPEVPKCARVDCGFPGYFPHGTVFGRSYLFADVIEYRCEDGYELIGIATRECLENGSWSGEQPKCKGRSGFCDEILAPPRHGSMFAAAAGRQASGSAAVGDRVEFECDEGYHLRGAASLACLDGGKWNGDVPTCEEVTCPFPEEIRDRVTSPTSAVAFAVGESLRIECGALATRQTIECRASGAWNYTGSPCGSRCEGKPEHPQHGLLLGDPVQYAYEAGEVVRAKCRYGFRLVGDDFFTCDSDGSWRQGNAMSCTPIECARPVPPPNSRATVVLERYPYGRRMTFRCLPGYRQSGQLATRCDAEGKWSKLYGRCVEVEPEANL